MKSKELQKELKQHGFNRDIEIDEDAWREVLEDEFRSSRSLAAVEHRNEPTYRDNMEKESIELKDYRNRSMEGSFVAELEHYNPEFRPLMHIIVDVPIWLWKNRIKNWGPLVR